MILIASDLHDNLVNLSRLKGKLEEEPEQIWLAGDVGAPETYAEVAETWVGPIKAVAGNLETDIGQSAYIQSLSSKSNLKLSFRPFIFSFGRYQIMLSHDLADIGQTKGSSRLKVIVTGHTHRPDLSRQGTNWTINPGTLSGWPNPATAATVVFQPDPNFQLIRL